MSFLAGLSKTQKEVEAQEYPKLEPRLAQHLDRRQEQDRRDGYFHPSDLSYDFCPRAWCLYNWHPKGRDLKDQSWGPQMKRILDNGTGLHDRMQRYLQEMDLLWGRWNRPIGLDVNGEFTYEQHYGYAPKREDGSIDLTWTYQEVKLRNPERNIIGHTDGLMPIEGFSRHGFKYGKWGAEIKSINSRGYRWLGDDPEDGMKTTHKDQTLIYADALEYERGLGGEGWFPADCEGWDFWQQPLEGFIIIYEQKDLQEIREYPIPFDQKVVDGFFDSMQEKMETALKFKAAVEAGKTVHYPHCTCGKTRNVLCKRFKVG